eukprot:TRINITY_DN8593_c0_g1_i4.p1 TRINITY_DN8593_c0_g1~~TRINITY_DN8593_c0_g1_i4.p1  ORF type:complete len:319 (-),score=46.04 TRINITY_DN8593_c0_g1_i4:16-972(-)
MIQNYSMKKQRRKLHLLTLWCKKWAEMPLFKVEPRSEQSLLEIVANDSTIEGESYFGYQDLISKLREYKGITVYEDGSILEAEYDKGIIVNKCRKIFANIDVYEGEMRDGLFHGEGKYSKADGSSLTVKWENGLPHGVGEEKSEDGTTYQGAFSRGIKSGFGKLIFPDGTEYEGNFLEGRPHGKGSITKPNGERYEGDWNNGLRHGKGVLWHENDDRYEGDFENGVKQGFGKFFWKDGRIAEGNWVNGRQHGRFILIVPQKGRYNCQYEAGKFVHPSKSVSYTHLTLPTIPLVQISVVSVSLKKTTNKTIGYLKSVII